MKRGLVSIIIITSLILASVSFINQNNILDVTGMFIDDGLSFKSERIFNGLSYKKTHVTQLTSNKFNDNIFYQEPNHFSPDSSKYLFMSKRIDGKNRIYVMDMVDGNINLISKNAFWGWSPSWSADNKIIYTTLGKIHFVDVNKSFNEDIVNIQTGNVISFIRSDPSGSRIIFVEEEHVKTDHHKSLSIINFDGEDYRRLFFTNEKNIFYIDHPVWINDDEVLFLTRGFNRNFSNDFNKPFIINVNNNKIRRIPVECSHYDVNPKGDKILCATEGYIIDLYGNILKNFKPYQGHGAWHPDGNTFLITVHPGYISKDSVYQNKIIIMDFNSDKRDILVNHFNSYNSSAHSQPNAQFSRDGKYIIYESDYLGKKNTDLFLVETGL